MARTRAAASSSDIPAAVTHRGLWDCPRNTAAAQPAAAKRVLATPTERVPEVGAEAGVGVVAEPHVAVHHEHRGQGVEGVEDGAQARQLALVEGPGLVGRDAVDGDHAGERGRGVGPVGEGHEGRASRTVGGVVHVEGGAEEGGGHGVGSARRVRKYVSRR